jgi:3-oxoacyl-[acyl-carrier protein] reductase
MAANDISNRNASRELSGRSAVVTGASSGIGRAIALQLAAAGADVLVHARASVASASEVALQVQSLGGRGEVVLADLADATARQSLVDAAWGWSPAGIDIWVNNAGADVLTGAAADWSFERKLQRLWQVDVLGTICLARAVGQRMMDRLEPSRDYCILNMGWDQVDCGMEGDSGEMFSATKGAVMAFSRSLAHTLAPHVRVNCLAPGWIRTAWGEEASEYWQQRAKRDSLLQRWGTPEDVAFVARFLASPAAAFVTGQTVAINGGRQGLSNV